MVDGNSNWNRLELSENTGNYRFANSRQNATFQMRVLPRSATS
jgi:hypothetical protein